MQEIQETQVQSLGQEDPVEEEVATCSSILVWKSHGQRNLAGSIPWGPKSQTRLKGFSMHAQEREQKAEAAGDGMRLGSWPECPVVCPLLGVCGAHPILSYADFEWDWHLQ